MTKLRFGWVGFHVEGMDALRALVANGHQVVAILTLEEELLAKRSGAGDYAALAKELAIPLYRVTNINRDETVALLRELELDLLFVIGWSQLLKGPALATARIGVIGAHASLLPSNRGSAPINWALIHGDTKGGNTLIWLDEAVDEGEIAAQESLEISEFDTCDTLYQKVAVLNTRMICDFARRAQMGDLVRRPQTTTDEAVLPRRRPEHGAIDWRWDSRRIYNFVRAVTKPYPGAFATIESQRYLIWEATLLPVNGYAPAGTIMGPAISPDPRRCGLLVSCGSGCILIGSLEDDQGRVLQGFELAQLPWSGKSWDIVDNELDRSK